MSFFTVITVTYKDGDKLQRTFDSILSQTENDFELIVVSGDDKAHPPEVIADNTNIISRLIYQKSSGPYAAMNEAIKHATGQYIYFLNGGDALYNKNVLKRVKNLLKNNNMPAFAYGDINLVTTYGGKRLKTYPNIGTRFLWDDTICHQSLFVSQDSMQAVGEFDLSYKICADYDWLLRAIYGHHKKSLYMPKIIANFYLDGLSSNTNGMTERARIKRNQMPVVARIIMSWTPIRDLIFRATRRVRPHA